eukprot:TRINITY_DN2122_c0_g2_i2.p2 TRINITY_DN2122_c0_g2~~TRINITY_DN2122_c0_g2_i2.p2  ORF type:complete len:106 (+),score=18.58 TRINITY_DN2122_c0_g2_i2:356-673(+)
MSSDVIRAKEMESSVPGDLFDKVKDKRVKHASILRGQSLLHTTSKLHRFPGGASIKEALEWVAAQDTTTSMDATLIFDDGSGLIFMEGKFTEYETMSDEEDEDES